MRIGVWGDSIVYGGGDEDALGWVGRLRKKFEKNDTQEIQLYNLGVCGDNSVDIVRRFKIEAESISVDSVVFAFGINDSKKLIENGENRVPQTQFKENVEILIAQAREITPYITFIGITNVSSRIGFESEYTFTNTEIQKYNQIIKDVVQKNGLNVIETFGILNEEDDFVEGASSKQSWISKAF